MLIDIHSHIGRLSPDRREFVDATNLIAKMDAWGIDRSIVLAASESPECTSLEVYTNDVVAACARYPVGPVKPGGAVPRLMRQYANLWGDISAGSGHNALTRDPAFGLEFMEEFQDRLLFGTDSCKRSDVNSTWNTVALFRDLRDSPKLPPEALEKIGWKNVAGLLHLNVAGSGS